MTGNEFPAIVAFPDLCDDDEFCVHETVTDPEPLPPVGETVIQEPLPEADQLPTHPAGEAVIVTLVEPPEELGLAEDGLIEKLQGTGAAPCVTENG